MWQTPDTIQTLLHYPGPVQVYFEGTFSNARNGAMAEFMATDGTLTVDRGGFRLVPERNVGKSEELILGTDPVRGRDFYDKPDGELLHLTNWIDCVRSRLKPNAPAEAGVSSASAAHLGNRAYKEGGSATWKGGLIAARSGREALVGYDPCHPPLIRLSPIGCEFFWISIGSSGMMRMQVVFECTVSSANSC